MTLKPWRELAIPHQDVLKGTFQQAEFAADITAVSSGKASEEYQDAVAFFARTYITEGMRLLLTQVAQRLGGKGGEPVIQLQTAFGGGKTHTMLAVWHLATRKVPLSELAGIPTLIEQAGLMDVPPTRVAVLDGNAHSPGQAWKHGRTAIKTLWGELAWQLGGYDGFALVKEADANGTSPGKEVLRTLLETYAPCVVLIDELVAYMRQFDEGKAYSGGTYDSNLSFAQALTEAVKLVPTAVVLASLPESNTEAGSSRGQGVLKALEKTFGRVQAIWKPVATEEAFAIVRRRLFDNVQDMQAVDDVCAAFANQYVQEGARLPSETQEANYRARLQRAYPIHPEVFDRLYEDWTTIDGFQRTRGVLKLMAKVISRLWNDNNKDLLILPSSLPLYHGDIRNEMAYLLPQGWDAVIEGDIDGERSEPTELEKKEPRFGQIKAARGVARTLFLGTAPSSVAAKPSGTRGLDRGRVLLGCLQPGQASAIYSDALNRLVDRCHYLNSTGDKTADNTRYWFDTRANLRREMEDRKRRFDDKGDVRKKIEDVLKKTFSNLPLFEGVHVFTPHGDVPDDSALRLVLLTPEQWYSKEGNQPAFDAVQQYLKQHGPQPRQRANRLLFIAADQAVIARLMDATRTALAWVSIVDDIKDERLVVDGPRSKQANNEANAANAALPNVARECYKWLLCPHQESATDAMTLDTKALSTSGPLASALNTANEDLNFIIQEWAAIHLRTELQTYYWKNGKTTASFKTFWDDSQRYHYLPRLLTRAVLERAIMAGAPCPDFFGTASGEVNGKYEGFRFNDPEVTFNDALLLIEPTAAQAYQAAEKAKTNEGAIPPTRVTVVGGGNPPSPLLEVKQPTTGMTKVIVPPKAKSFHGSADVPAATAKMRLRELAEELIELLAADPNATVSITLEINAQFPNGAADQLKRAVSENANNLGLKIKEWD